MSHLLRALVLAVAFASGCGGSIEISKGPMSGRIGGMDWSFGSAETNSFLSSSDQFFVDAYDQVVAPCTGAGNAVSSNRLIMNVPRAPGDYLLGIGLNVTFYVQSTGFNYIATQGRIVVSQVMGSVLSGGGHFIFDNDNEVDGQFQAEICPP